MTINEKLDCILYLLQELGAGNEAILREVEALRQTPTVAPPASGSTDLLWRTTPSVDDPVDPDPPPCCPGCCPEAPKPHPHPPEPHSHPPHPHPELHSHPTSRWLLRSFGSRTKTLGSKQTGSLRATGPPESGGVLEPNRFQFDVEGGPGLGFEFERLLGDAAAPTWGWTIGLAGTDLEGVWMFDTPEVWIRENDHLPTTTLITGLNRHWRGDRWDLFAGPLLALLDFGSATLADGTATPGAFTANFDSSFAFGAGLGLDIPVRPKWGLTAALQYLDVSIDSGALAVDVNPLTARLGVVYRFDGAAANRNGTRSSSGTDGFILKPN